MRLSPGHDVVHIAARALLFTDSHVFPAYAAAPPFSTFGSFAWFHRSSRHPWNCSNSSQTGRMNVYASGLDSAKMSVTYRNRSSIRLRRSISSSSTEVADWTP